MGVYSFRMFAEQRLQILATPEGGNEQIRPPCFRSWRRNQDGNGATVGSEEP